jgi:hypothetical protein
VARRAPGLDEQEKAQSHLCVTMRAVIDVPGLVAKVGAALEAQGIKTEGPFGVAPAALPIEIAQRATPELRATWSHGVGRLKWHDHEAQRLGRDARHGGIWFMTPAEARSEAREYAAMIDDEREFADSSHLALAEQSWLIWTPFHRFASGDCLAVEPDGEVVLWQHDLLDGGPYYHGLRLGSSLDDFLHTWARVGFAEPRDWREVATTDRPGLDLSRADWRLLL